MADEPLEVRPDAPMAPASADQQLQEAKTATTLALFGVFSEVFEAKIKDGSLAAEVGQMKAGQAIRLFAQLAATLKPAGPVVGIQINAPNPQVLQTFSARKLTPEERERLSRKMDKERGA